MRTTLLLAVFLVLISCKSETKEQKTTIENTTKTEEVVKAIYPKLEGVPQSLNYIFDEGYLYSEEIQLDEVAVFKNEDNNYNFIIYLDEDTNIEILQNFTLGFIVYPKDLSVLKTEKEKRTKSKAIGLNTADVYSLDDSLVLCVKDFKIDTNEFNLIKIYFYNKDGVLNGNILKLSNLKL